MKEETKKGIIAEFKEFINRGSVIDLAVGVVVGGAFTAIVNSLVNDIIMPIVGIALNGVDFTHLSFTVRDASINYGNFLQNVLNFLIIAFCIFMVVKTMNRMRESNKSLLEKAKAKALLAAEKATEKATEKVSDRNKEKSKKSK